MALDQLGSIGSIISGIAVVISLIYLAIQIRQNTEAGRTSTYQSIVSDFGTMNNNLAGNPELSHMFVDALENYHEFNDQEKARISQMFFQIFRMFENMFYQQKKGYLDQDLWIGWKRLMLTYFARPGFQTWWEHRRVVYAEPFVQFLETEKLDLNVKSYKELTSLEEAASLK